MELTNYNNYKDSGIQWLGEIPAHWEIKRIKDLCELQSGESVSAIEFTDEGYPVYGGNGFRGYFSKYNHNGEYILIGRQGALCGNINYARDKFWATEHAVVVYKPKAINILWYGELLRLMNLNQYSLAAAQPGLSVDKIKRLELSFAPKEEQDIIARYLDHKTAAIDQKVALLEQKITHYQDFRKSLINETVCRGLDKSVPLKESGIDWIGQVPAHWEVKRLKNIFDQISVKGSNLRVNTYIPLENIQSFTGKLLRVSSNDNNEETLLFQKGDLLINKLRPYLGKVLLAEFDGGISGEAVVNRIKVLMKRKVSNRYFFYRFLSTQFIYLLNSLTDGVRMPRANPSKLEALAITLPPLAEQTAITNYLDEKTQKIDAISRNLKTQIETLREFRKTLINDVVTGKIRVTAATETASAGAANTQSLK